MSSGDSETPDGPVVEVVTRVAAPVPWTREDVPGLCPNCGVHAALSFATWIGIWPTLAFAVSAGPGAGEDRRLHEGSVNLVVRRCQYCGKTVSTLHQVTYDEGSSPSALRQNFSNVQVWPARTPRELDVTVPAPIRSLFAEASVCENAGAMRAAGVMYRSAVEELVKDQGATGSTLYAKIDSIGVKLGEDLAKNLHEARMVGNDSIHDGLPYSADEVADIADLIEEACFLLYVQPAQRARFRDQRAARRAGTAGTG